MAIIRVIPGVIFTVWNSYTTFPSVSFTEYFPGLEKLCALTITEALLAILQ